MSQIVPTLARPLPCIHVPPPDSGHRCHAPVQPEELGRPRYPRATHVRNVTADVPRVLCPIAPPMVAEQGGGLGGGPRAVTWGSLVRPDAPSHGGWRCFRLPREKGGLQRQGEGRGASAARVRRSRRGGRRGWPATVEDACFLRRYFFLFFPRLIFVSTQCDQ
jgi:hypothetical protein